jgi:integrase
MKLNQKIVNTYQPNGMQQWINDDDVAGLRLFVGAKVGKTWWIRFRADGAQLSHKIGSADAVTVAQARDLARAFLAKLAAGENPHRHEPKPNNIKLGELVDIYEPWVYANKKGGMHTVSMLRAAFEFLLKKRVIDLKVEVLETWQAQQVNGGRKKATTNRYCAALKALLSWGVDKGKITVNPLIRLKPQKETDSEPIIRYLTKAEYARLMTALDEREAKMRDGRDSHNIWLKGRRLPLMPAMKGEYADYLKPLVILALNTGARRGGLFGLKWSDVDLENKIILFRAANAKSEKPLRVHLNSTAVDMLSKWRLQNAHKGKDDYIFSSPKTGGRLTNINKSWAALMKSAQIEDFRFHDTRHNYASDLIQAGNDIYTVKKLLGHSNIKITEKYAHLNDEQLAAAVESVVKKRAQ